MVGYIYFHPIMVIFVVNISGSTVEAYIDDHNTFSGLFFQDGIMKWFTQHILRFFW